MCDLRVSIVSSIDAFGLVFRCRIYARVALVSRSMTCRRLWYVTASARKTAGAADQLNNSVPVEIGYMNVIPKCLDSSGKYPVYENLPETYAAINSYLADNPLEGFTYACSRRPLPRGSLVPICIEIGSFVFNIVLRRLAADERTNGQDENTMPPRPVRPGASVKISY